LDAGGRIGPRREDHGRDGQTRRTCRFAYQPHLVGHTAAGARGDHEGNAELAREVAVGVALGQGAHQPARRGRYDHAVAVRPRIRDERRGVERAAGVMRCDDGRGGGAEGALAL
jgi:hypothetical protein